ncbi:hypothetical protein ABKV19_022700 [Rosa sericea]
MMRLAVETLALVVLGQEASNREGRDSESGARPSVKAVVGSEGLSAVPVVLGLVTEVTEEQVVALGGPASEVAEVATGLAALEKPAGNPNFELGLTAGLTGALNGSGGPGDLGLTRSEGSAGPFTGLAAGRSPNLGLGVRKKAFKPSLAFIPPEFQLGELVEVPISM